MIKKHLFFFIFPFIKIQTMIGRICGVLLCIIIALNQGQSQSPENLQLSKNMVIENVMLVEKAGLSPKKVNIVIHKGIIKEIITTTNYPPDAVVIKADSLYAYPAFIDAGSHTAYPKKEEEKQERASDPGNPGYDLAGVTPQHTVHDQLNLTDGSVDKMRKAGFAVSHVLPRGRMLSGQGSVVLLKADETIPYLKKDASMYGTFKSAQGRVFPSTVIGVMTKHRELFKQAEYAKRYENSYASSPLGMERPAYPEQIQALYPVLDKSQPFFFHAEKTLDVSRALTLNKDLKSKMILTEVKQIGPNIDRLKALGVPILISLDLPKTMEEEKDSTKVISDSEQKLIERKKAAIKEYQSLAMTLKSQSIPFGFSFLETKPGDLQKKVTILMENGMSKDDILKALTIDAATILGISNVTGTLERNKLANIILTDGEIFEKETTINYTIVEGKLYKHDVKKKKKMTGDKDAKVDLAGAWTATAKIPGQEQSVKLIFKKEDDEYSGVLVDDEGDEYQLKNVELQGNILSFELSFTQQGMTIDMSVSAQVETDDFEGTISVNDFGSFPFEGSRLSNPEK